MQIITHLHSTAKYNILQNKLKKTALSDSLFSTLTLRLVIRDPDI